jgi:hypothetical protein
MVPLERVVSLQAGAIWSLEEKKESSLILACYYQFARLLTAIFRRNRTKAGVWLM